MANFIKTLTAATATPTGDWVPLNPRCPEFNVGYHVTVVSAAPWILEGTLETGTLATGSAAFSLASGTADAHGAFTQPVRAVRVRLNGPGAGDSATVKVLQAGVNG